MSEPTNEPTNEPSNQHSDETQPVPVAEPAPAASRPGWRERVYGLRAVAAATLAGLIIGGGAGVAIHAAVGDDGGRDGRDGRDGHGGHGGHGDHGRPGGSGDQGELPQPPNGMPVPPNGAPNLPQPTVPPQDEVAPGA